MILHRAFARPSAPSVSVALFAAVLALAVPTVSASIPTPTNKLYGLITSNRTLTFALPGPNYQVLGDVVVTPGATLTIEPGVVLNFAANHDTLEGGNNPNLSELTIQGSLVANASANDSIRFISSAGGAEQWAGIVVEAGGTAMLQHVAIRGALNGILSSGNVLISHAAVSDAAYGLLLFGSATVSHSEFQNVGNGIRAYGTGTIYGCNVTGRGAGSSVGLWLGSGTTTSAPDSVQPAPTTISQFSLGVSLEGGVLRNAIVRDNSTGVTLNSGGLIDYCTIARNASHGIASSGCWSLARIQNSLITNNGGGGVSVCLQSGSFADYLDSWSNAGGNYSIGSLNFTPGPSRLSFNPFYVNPVANDFRLASGSIFYTYSASGGQLGAYGPGAGLPTSDRRKSWGALKVRYR